MQNFKRVREELEEFLPQPAAEANRTIAVLLPCYNEEAAIAAVIEDFRQVLPSATIYVYDNNSTDKTIEVARRAGATVRSETYQGKGNVVRRMLADIDADIYVLADGDATYDTSAAGDLIDALVAGNLDMVVGTRTGGGPEAYRRGHQWGNRFFNRAVSHLFGTSFTDILSGYRVLSRRFAKTFPVTSSGFEIETELCVHALDLKIATLEIALPYAARPEGSESKLRTYHDGARILWAIFRLYRDLQPRRFFGAIGIALMIASMGLGVPLIATYFDTGLVPRIPTAVLAATMMQLGFLSIGCGLVLDSVAKGRREAKRLRYLELSSVAARP